MSVRFRRGSAAHKLRLELLESGRVDHLPIAAPVPGSARIGLATVAHSGGIVEILVDKSRASAESGRWRSRLAHALQRRRERLHVRDLSCHQELQRVDRALIFA